MEKKGLKVLQSLGFRGKIQLRKPARCDADAVDKAEGCIRTTDIARSRRGRRVPSSGQLPKGFSRNPGELAIPFRKEGYQPPRETGGDRDRWMSSLTNPQYRRRWGTAGAVVLEICRASKAVELRKAA